MHQKSICKSHGGFFCNFFIFCRFLYTITYTLKRVESGEINMGEMQRKPMPVGIEDFEAMIVDDYYYVDKTLIL